MLGARVSQPSFAATKLLDELAPERPVTEMRLHQIIRDCRNTLAKVAPLDAVGIYVVLGRARWRLRKFGDSLADMQKALKLDPDNVALLSILGACHVALGQLTEALDPLLRAFPSATAPTDRVVILGNLAEAFWKLGERDLALEAFQQAQQEASSEAAGHQLVMANQAVELGAYEAAFGFLSKFLSLWRQANVDARQIIEADELSEDEENMLFASVGLRRLVEQRRALGRWVVGQMLQKAPADDTRTGEGAEAVFAETRSLRSRATREALEGERDESQGS